MNKVITARIEMTQEQQLELAREIMADRKETIAELEAKVEELSEALKNANKGLKTANTRNRELSLSLQVINKVINAREVGKLPKKYNVWLEDTKQAQQENLYQIDEPYCADTYIV
jgi:phage-related tail protein